MRFVHTANCTHMLGAPLDWDAEPGRPVCDPLPVQVNADPPAFISTWAPSEAEVQAIVKGSRLQLWCYGHGHPPVALVVENVPTAPHAYDKVKMRPTRQSALDAVIILRDLFPLVAHSAAFEHLSRFVEESPV